MNSKKKAKGFQKGVVTNPNGRPKGSYSPLRKNIMRMRYLAAEKANEAFNKLWQDFQDGDVVAKQIMFKELLNAPKEWLSEVDTSEVLKDIKQASDIPSVLISLINVLLNSDTLSREILSILKALCAINISENSGDEQKEESYQLSEDRVETIMGWITEKKRLTYN